MSDLYFPEKIFIQKKSLNFPLTEKILERAGHIPTEIIENAQDLIADFGARKDPLLSGKKTLFITQQKGAFVKPCPCTPGYVGCNYFIINTDLNCPLDCTYCILQNYLDNPLITVHVNTEHLWRQIDLFLSRLRHQIIRIGTGELGDSLVLDHLTDRSKEMLGYFRERKNVLFELKTKTTNISNVLESPPSENIVIAWSLNSEKIAQEEEKGAPSIAERLEAAHSVMKRGYRVAFHFDPIIRYPGWEEGYAQVVDQMLTKIDAQKIAWISLGSLRFPPPLKEVISKRFPQSRILYEELIRGKDGKFRYFKPLRIQLYKNFVKFLRKTGKEIPVYFCMESGEVWEKILKKEPKDKEDVQAYLSYPLVSVDNL
ncbi:MAG: spore photoproduct lyase family protein [Candidatus Aminicenantaceae bacterium]